MGRGRTGSPELMRLSAALRKWRERGGGRGTKIPERLWKRVVEVARTDGVWVTAKATRIKHGKIKGRLGRAERGRKRRDAPTRNEPQQGFVEVAAAPLIGAEMGTVVEVDDGGVRLTVRLGAGERLEVAQLVSAFRRGA